MRHTLGVPALAVLLVAATPAAFGGWTVVTVKGLPPYLEAGKPTPLQFEIRQHGRTPMDDRSPTVTLETVGKEKGMLRALVTGRNRSTAHRLPASGLYEATITAEDTGLVSITIDSDWYGSEVTLLPVRVVAGGGTVEPLARPELGRQLFVAKGCVTCHVKGDDAEVMAHGRLSVGPELTERTYSATWLAEKLADPAKNRVPFNEYVQMPNLGLAQDEIAALVSYINQPRERVAAGRR